MNHTKRKVEKKENFQTLNHTVQEQINLDPY